MANWESPEVTSWEGTARAEQQQLADLWGARRWDVFLQSERHLLEQKVGEAFFGPIPEGSRSYSRKQTRTITKICDIVARKTKHYTNLGQARTAIVFVSALKDKEAFTVPLLRVLKLDYADDLCNHRFIDTSCRVYKNWQHFLANNRLPRCLLIYPADGIYVWQDGQLNLCRGESRKWFNNPLMALRPWQALPHYPTRVVHPTVASTAMKSALFLARSVSGRQVPQKQRVHEDEEHVNSCQVPQKQSVHEDEEHVNSRQVPQKQSVHEDEEHVNSRQVPQKRSAQEDEEHVSVHQVPEKQHAHVDDEHVGNHRVSQRQHSHEDEVDIGGHQMPQKLHAHEDDEHVSAEVPRQLHVHEDDEHGSAEVPLKLHVHKDDEHGSAEVPLKLHVHEDDEHVSGLQVPHRQYSIEDEVDVGGHLLLPQRLLSREDDIPDNVPVSEL